MKRATFLWSLLAILLQGMIWGQIPETISYQGVLRDDTGNAVAEGDYELHFNLYDGEAGGSPLWSETFSSVNVTGGVFHVILGSINPLSLSFDRQYWLGVTVGGDTEFSPRIQLTSSPYSLISESVLGSSNTFPSDGNVGIGTTSPGATLHVQGGSLFNGDISIEDNEPVLHFRDTVQPLPAGYWRMLVGGDDNFYLQKNTAEANDFSQVYNFTFSNDGKFGIGTTSPELKLDVVGPDGTGIRLGDENSGSYRASLVSFEQYGGVLNLNDASDGSIKGKIRGYSADGVQAFFTAGNVGIGTASPSEKLQVGGNVRVGLLTEDDGSTPGYGDYLYFSGGDDWSGVDSDNSDPLWIARYNAGSDASELRVNIGDEQSAADKFVIGSTITDTWTPAFTLQTDGNVGIGTTSPSTTLDVSGTFKVSGATTLNSIAYTWPSADGTSGQMLSTDAAGTLSWSSVTPSPAGTDGQVQYNDGGSSFGGAASLYYDDTNNRVGIGTTTPASTFETGGSFATSAIREVTATVFTTETLTASDYIILVDNTVAITVALPTAVGIKGRRYIIKKISAGAMIPTIDPSGSETIDGSETYSGLDVYMESIEVISDGSNWFIIGKGAGQV